MTGPGNPGGLDQEPLVHPLTGEVLDPDNVPLDARVAFLEVALRDTQSAVDELLSKLADEARGGRPSRWSWQHAGACRRREMWAELAAFVDWLIARYQPTNDTVIPRCWYRHPVAVEELWALMVAWRAAYCAGNRPSDQLIGWHQHWLWPCLQRLHTYAKWTGCGAEHKDPTGVRPGLTNQQTFADFVASPAALDPGPGDPAGAPTPEPTGSTTTAVQEQLSS